MSVRLARHPVAAMIAEKLGLVGQSSRDFISMARNSDINWADATIRIPLASDSAAVIYSAHMLEHLDRHEARRFLQEAYRVLAPNGSLRITVPDLKKLIDEYNSDGDADSLVRKTLLTRERPKRLGEKLRYLVIGERDHLWMYDGPSLCQLVSSVGFRSARCVEPGTTSIPDPGALDLYERANESISVEALK
jgi:SAM-dependent methyltransferase